MNEWTKIEAVMQDRVGCWRQVSK